MPYGYSQTMAALIKERHEDDPSDVLFAVCALCVDRGITPSAIASRVGVSKQAVYMWLQQNTSPSPAALDELKKYLKELNKKQPAKV